MKIRQTGIAYIRVSSKKQKKRDAPLKQYDYLQDYLEAGNVEGFSHPDLKGIEIVLDQNIEDVIKDNISGEQVTKKGIFFESITGYDEEKRNRMRKEEKLKFDLMVKYLKKQNGNTVHLLTCWTSRLYRGDRKGFGDLKAVCIDLYKKTRKNIYIHCTEDGTIFSYTVWDDAKKANDHESASLKGKAESIEKSRHSKKGKARAHKEGLLAYDSPWGYTNYTSEEGEVKAKFNEYAPMVKKWFYLRGAKKKSVTEIKKWTDKKGYQTDKGKPFAVSTIRRCLSSRFYLGEIKHSKIDHITKEVEEVSWKKSNTHPALISEELFNLVNPKKETGVDKPKISKDGNPLAQLMKCGICGSSIQRDFKANGKYVYFRCGHSRRNLKTKSEDGSWTSNWYLDQSKKENWLKKYGVESTGKCIVPVLKGAEIWEMINHEVGRLHFPEDVKEELGRILKEEGMKIKTEMEQEYQDLKDRLEAKEAEYEKWIMGVGKYNLPEGQVERIANSYELDVTQMKHEKAELEKRKDRDLTEVQKVLETVSNLWERWNNGLSETRKIELLEIMSLEIKYEMEGLNIIWGKPFDKLLKINSSFSKNGKKTSHQGNMFGVRKELAQIDTTKLEHIERVLGESK